jgi:hypothetical protein
MLQFKIGTQPLMRHEVKDYPMVGDRLYLPYPTGGIYPVIITEIDFNTDITKSIFRGEWM